MVTDAQVRKLRKLLAAGTVLAMTARKTGMDEKTARKYREAQSLRAQTKTKRSWRTRTDPFAQVWPDVQQRLENEPRLRAFTLFDWLQDQYPGQFLDSQRRTFERRVRRWRGTSGPNQEVIFPQRHDFSESFESLSRGLQQAFWELGGAGGKAPPTQQAVCPQPQRGGQQPFGGSRVS